MDIKGLCKVRVFKALFNRAMPQGMGFLHYKPRNIDDDEAKKKIQFSDGKEIQYFDYVEGRVMKIDIRPDYIDTTLYNRDNGPNAAENAILEEFTKP